MPRANLSPRWPGLPQRKQPRTGPRATGSFQSSSPPGRPATRAGVAACGSLACCGGAMPGGPAADLGFGDAAVCGTGAGDDETVVWSGQGRISESSWNLARIFFVAPVVTCKSRMSASVSASSRCLLNPINVGVYLCNRCIFNQTCWRTISRSLLCTRVRTNKSNQQEHAQLRRYDQTGSHIQPGMRASRRRSQSETGQLIR